MPSKVEKKRVARKRKNERAKVDRRRSRDADRHHQRIAPLGEVWTGSGNKEFMDGKDTDERLKKVSLKKVLSRFQTDRPELVEALRPLISHRGRPPGVKTCRELTTALTVAAWDEYADLPDFAPMVAIGQQKDIRVGHVGTEEDAVGHGMSVRYNDYNPVLFLAKTGKVGAVSYRRSTLKELERFLTEEPRTSALLLDATHGESSIRKEVILDGNLVSEPENAVLGKKPEKKKEWDPAPFRELVAKAAAAIAALVVPEPVVKWRVERKDDHNEILTNPDGGWRPFDTQEEASVAVPDDSWHVLETPVVTPDINPGAASRAKSDAERMLAATVNTGPCVAVEKLDAAAKALDGSKGGWGETEPALEVACGLLEETKEAAVGRPSTPAVALWLRTGMKEEDGSRVYAKIGYLPLWLHEEKAHVVAERFMPCGSKGTPEHGVAGMEDMSAEDATLARLVVAYGSQETVMALTEMELEPLIAVLEGRGERPTFAPLTGFLTSTEDRLSG